MEHEGALQTLAQISIVFTGFALVVASIGTESKGMSVPLSEARVQELLKSSLSVTFGAMLPVFFDAIDPLRQDAYRYSAFVQVCFGFHIAFTSTKSFAAIRKSYEYIDEKLRGLLMIMTWTTAAVIFCSYAVVIFNIVEWHFSFYYLALMLGLFLIAHQFFLAMTTDVDVAHHQNDLDDLGG